MKKILFSSILFFFAVCAFAQNMPVKISASQAKQITAVKQNNPFVQDQVANPANSDRYSSGLITNPGSYIGSTYYDHQTNACQHHKISIFNDGTISAVWTSAPRNGDALRGTGYNYFDGTQWINAYNNIRKVESERTGWGVSAPVGTDGEIIAAHFVGDPEAMKICVRPHKGTGDWTESYLFGPEVWDSTHTVYTRGLSWPDIATNGNTIHLIACTEQKQGYLYNGIRCALLYFRGTYDESSNTVTWEQPRIVYDATPDMMPYFSGDRYSIAANGNNVAIVAPSPLRDLMVWKSTDNGVTFNTITVFDNPLVEDQLAPMAIDTNVKTTIPNGVCNIALDDNGKVHLAFDLQIMKWAEIGDVDRWTYYPYMGCMTYWNEDMATYSTRGAMYPDTLKSRGLPLFECIDLNGDDSTTFINFKYISQNFEGAYVSYPQLACEGNNVYMIYNSILEYPFISTMSTNDVVALWGVFGTRSTDGGQTWNNGTSWLSYNKQCFYIDDWDSFSDETYTSCLNIDGESVFPTMAKTLVNGKLAMYWQEDPFPDIATDYNNVSFIFYLSLTADSLGIYNNTQEIHQGMWIDPLGIADNTLEGMKLYPNPASDYVKVAIVSGESSNANVTVFNLMGQCIYSENVVVYEGENTFNLNTNDLNAGVYMVNVKTNKGTSTQKLIVK